MKRFCLIIILLFFCQTLAVAEYTTDYMVSDKFFKYEGFSPEIHRLIRFETEPEKIHQELEASKKNKIKYHLKKLYVYLDPYTDQGTFGANDVDFRPFADF